MSHQAPELDYDDPDPDQYDPDDERWACNRCGDCCRHFGIQKPILDEDVIESLEEGIVPGQINDNIRFYNLHDGISAGITTGGPTGWAIHVNIESTCDALAEHGDGTSTCTIYDDRPYVCEHFPGQGIGPDSPQFPHCPPGLKLHVEEQLAEDESD